MAERISWVYRKNDAMGVLPDEHIIQILPNLGDRRMMHTYFELSHETSGYPQRTVPKRIPG